MPMDYEEKLLKEYELCSEHATKLENIIWQTATIFGVGSVVGFVALSVNTLSLNPLLVIVGLLAIGILIMWWRFARRWWSIQHTMFRRMEHIEKELHLKGCLYVRYLNRIKNPETKDDFEFSPVSESNQQPYLKQEFISELKNFENYEYHGIQPMVRFFLLVSISAWIAFIIIQIPETSVTFTLTWLLSKLTFHWLVVIIYFVAFLSLYIYFSRKS